MNDKTRDIDLKVEINAPVDEVWKMLTEAQGLANWFPLKSRVSQPGVGGKVLLSWGEYCEWETNVEIWEPNKHLRWVDEMPGEDGKTVRMATDFYLQTEQGKTVLRLVNSGFSSDEKWDEQYEGTKAGWAYFLYNLQHYLEYHAGKVRDMVHTHPKFTGTRAEVWKYIFSAASGLFISLPVELAIGQLIDVKLSENKTCQGVIRVVYPERTLGIELPELDHALLFIEMEPGAENMTCGFWLSTYGAAGVDDIRGEFIQHVEKAAAK
ncbi:MAG: SRPBCC domain-containing protein [Gammaproteobacteria bacterium]|nr:SRPBCC domain-containing protein [Gammaproteobacteria bacterium]